MCELLVGLPAVAVLGVEDRDEGPLVVMIEQAGPRPLCGDCGKRPVVKDREVVELVDLPAFGRQTRLLWRKFRFRCPQRSCPTASWTWADDAIAWPRHAMTDRAGRWATLQVGKEGRTVTEVARDLGCDWHTVSDAVVAYGTPMVDDPDRISDVGALGLDETLFCRQGRWRSQRWCTSIVDVSPGHRAQLLDVVPGRSAAGPSQWLLRRPTAWLDRVAYGVLDLSGPYRKTFDDVLPDAVQVADPFHLVKLANAKLDECRRRVQNETLGHRGRKHDPLYRCRRLLTKAHERLEANGTTKLMGLLNAGDPRGEVRTTWLAKETVRSVYDITDPAVASRYLDGIVDDFVDPARPIEVRSLGRTIDRWFDQIVAWHDAFVSNGPTEAINNLIKRIKRIGFGFRSFVNYRIRILLYAGKPNWALLPTINPAEIR